jgi:magnesium-transporting ATPase (P-type)
MGMAAGGMFGMVIIIASFVLAIITISCTLYVLKTTKPHPATSHRRSRTGMYYLLLFVGVVATALVFGGWQSSLSLACVYGLWIGVGLLGVLPICMFRPQYWRYGVGYLALTCCVMFPSGPCVKAVSDQWSNLRQLCWYLIGG